jgi:CDP-4-dehydro-6-deoxyglucose reductase
MCKVEVLAGTVTHDATVAPSVLTEDERAMGTCLSCRAIAVTDIEIRLQDEILRCFFPPWLRQAAAPTSGD